MPRGECFVMNCLTGRRKHPGHVFSFPKTGDEQLKSAWLQNLPTRERPFDFDKDVVCHLHFLEEHMDICWTHQIGTKIVKTPKDRWRLLDGAVPTIFPAVPPRTGKGPRKRKATAPDEDEEAPKKPGGAHSSLPPGHLRRLLTTRKTLKRRAAAVQSDHSSDQHEEEEEEDSQEAGGNLSMLPPGYLKILSAACKTPKKRATSSKSAEESRKATGACKVPPKTAESLHSIFIVLPDASPAPVALPSPLCTESLPVISNVQSCFPARELPIADPASKVNGVELEHALNLSSICKHLKAEGAMDDSWTCNVLKDRQTDMDVLCCAELVSTHRGTEVLKSITITAQGHPKIHFRQTDVTPSFQGLACLCYTDVQSLLGQVQQAQLCVGLPSGDSMDEFCGATCVNNGLWFSVCCEQIVLQAGQQCKKCKAFEQSMEAEPEPAAEDKAQHPAAITTDQVCTQMRTMQRTQTYLKQRLDRVRKTNATLLQELKELRTASDSKLSDVEGMLEGCGLPDKQKLAFGMAIQAAKRSSKAAPFCSEWLLECNGILRQSSKGYEHLRTRNLLPLPTKKSLRKLLKAIPLARAAPPQLLASAMPPVTTIVLDEEQLRQLLQLSNGLRTEDVLVLGENQDHLYAQV